MEVIWKLSPDMAFIGYWLVTIISFLEVSIFPTGVSTQGNNFDYLSFCSCSVSFIIRPLAFTLDIGSSMTFCITGQASGSMVKGISTKPIEFGAKCYLWLGDNNG